MKYRKIVVSKGSQVFCIIYRLQICLSLPGLATRLKVESCGQDRTGGGGGGGVSAHVLAGNMAENGECGRPPALTMAAGCAWRRAGRGGCQGLQQCQGEGGRAAREAGRPPRLPRLPLRPPALAAPWLQEGPRAAPSLDLGQGRCLSRGMHVPCVDLRKAFDYTSRGTLGSPMTLWDFWKGCWGIDWPKLWD